MKRRKILLIIAVWSALGAILSLAQTSRSTLDGVYTLDQAQRGRDLYGDQCYECHGRDLMGAYESHTLVGDEFTSDFEGQPLLTLFDRIYLTMSGDLPGRIDHSVPKKLTRANSADLVAFLLWYNSTPPGATELSDKAEVLRSIRFDTPKP